MTLEAKRLTISRYVWRNTLAGLMVLLLWYVWLADNTGYAAKHMLPDNMAVINEHPDLSLDSRWEIKLKGSYQYLRFLRDNTPPNAVILYPARLAFFPTVSADSAAKNPFQGEPYNKIWATRFLYPRRLVLREEMATSKWGQQITHVAIVNKVGYDIFDDQSRPDSSQMVDFTVLPVK